MANPWSSFKRLTEKGRLMIVTIISQANGESLVASNIGQFRVNGTSVDVGDKAYIRNGVIEGEAPNLPSVGPFYV